MHFNALEARFMLFFSKQKTTLCCTNVVQNDVLSAFCRNRDLNNELIINGMADALVREKTDEWHSKGQEFDSTLLHKVKDLR